MATLTPHRTDTPSRADTIRSPAIDDRPVTPPEPPTGSTERRRGINVVWGLLRIAMGWAFLWAFLDKAFGLGFATGRNPETGAIDFFGPDAWINGGSPTDGFLSFGLHTKGFLVDFYSGLAGQAWVDWIYMASMLLIGAALMLGIATRLAVAGGVLWMAMFYSAAALWPENNPFLDDHIVYAIVLVGIALVGAGRHLGLGKRWERLPLVRRHPALR